MSVYDLCSFVYVTKFNKKKKYLLFQLYSTKCATNDKSKTFMVISRTYYVLSNCDT